jgi:hAT family C-terminal dimerisation region
VNVLENLIAAMELLGGQECRAKMTSLHYALDTLSCPAMSAECERVFSSAKKLITPERNQLGEDIIEACECLKAWWRNSLIEQQFGY